LNEESHPPLRRLVPVENIIIDEVKYLRSYKPRDDYRAFENRRLKKEINVTRYERLLSQVIWPLPSCPSTRIPPVQSTVNLKTELRSLSRQFKLHFHL
jgi:hypothetical protein